MELDLNEEPLDRTHTSVFEFDSLLNELESAAQGHIQDRIRHLEAITNLTGEAAATVAQGEGRQHQQVEEGVVESGKGGKKEGGAHLIAKALGLEETDASKAGGRTGKFFDCNVCLDKARDPVLTCCGHLFCWPCFYQLPYAYSDAKECPVCQGEVLRVAPRPQASRIESIRQKLINQQASSSMVQNIQRFSNLVGGLGQPVQSESPNTATDGNDSFLIESYPQTDNNQHTDSRPFQALLEQGAASFSSLSSAFNSAMDSAERFVEDLESYVHGQHIGGSRRSNRRAVYRNSTFNVVAGINQSVSLTQDFAATNSASAAYVSPINRNVDTVAVLGSGIQTTDSNIQINPLNLLHLTVEEVLVFQDSFKIGAEEEDRDDGLLS
ncbi:Zinc finger, RING-type [Sesbania bispinosa]|nr:Zinc finger, RING-type [Sesbania bispinosa]